MQESSRRSGRADPPTASASTPGPAGVDQRAADRLRLLIEASKALNSTLELEKLCDVILGMATEHCDADRATLFLREPGEDQLWSLLAQGVEPGRIRISGGEGVAGWVARTGETVNLGDAHADERFNPHFDEVLQYRTRSLVAVPIRDRDGTTVGVLELLNKRGGSFDEEDVSFLESISVHAAIALQNARWHRMVVEHQKVERDLALARSIHAGLLPQHPPRVPGFEIGVRHQISFFVGGDYYDFLPVERSNHIFVVADVEGKGAASALVVSNLQATLRTLVKQVHSLEGIMYHLNEAIWENTRGERYITLFLGLLDVARRGVHYINAGHLPPVVVRADSEIPLDRGGTVIGLFPSQRYERGYVSLEAGDVLVAFTDGITESSDAGGEEYGAERLVARIRASRSGTAPALVDEVLDDVSRFAAPGHAADDRIIMAVRADP